MAMLLPACLAMKLLLLLLLRASGGVCVRMEMSKRMWCGPAPATPLVLEPAGGAVTAAAAQEVLTHLALHASA